jgi:hypothetical protein
MPGYELQHGVQCDCVAFSWAVCSRAMMLIGDSGGSLSARTALAQ